jgi:hypothetical protein
MLDGFCLQAHVVLHLPEAVPGGFDHNTSLQLHAAASEPPASGRQACMYVIRVAGSNPVKKLLHFSDIGYNFPVHTMRGDSCVAL